jgi:hypothetical protein
MGLSIRSIEPILKEHLFQPFQDDVLLIGRQTIYFTKPEILSFMNSFGIQSRIHVDDIQIDKNTLNRMYGSSKEFIEDYSFFKMLGARSVKALDHSDYEGCEVIHDLSKLLPSALHGIADVVIDGSTLDNVFNPALTIKNLNELLRPGGRIILINTWSNHNEPYMVIPPLWFMDYFTLNGFIDCKVYIQVYLTKEVTNTFCIDLETLMNTTQEKYVCNFSSTYQMGLFIVAEKGINSTSAIYPIQQHYRSESEWETYLKNLEVIKNNPRPHVCRSNSPLTYLDIKRGHLFMDQNFQAVDPTEEMKRLNQII